jgi:misacylated tRNA(Ala) deacylase
MEAPPHDPRPVPADAYLTECSATVTAVTEPGIVLDRTVFYPLGGGQAGDAGVLVLADGTTLTIADTRKGKDAEGKPTADIVHVPAPGQEAAGHAGRGPP